MDTGKSGNSTVQSTNAKAIDLIADAAAINSFIQYTCTALDSFALSEHSARGLQVIMEMQFDRLSNAVEILTSENKGYS